MLFYIYFFPVGWRDFIADKIGEQIRPAFVERDTFNKREWRKDTCIHENTFGKVS